MNLPFDELLPADSFLEAAFLRWVLTPVCLPSVVPLVRPQHRVSTGEHDYRVDYALTGRDLIAIELDGYAFHSDRGAFTYDRLRQNDLTTVGARVLRFSYDAIRTRTAYCAEQTAALLRTDPVLALHVRSSIHAVPAEMPADPAYALARAKPSTPDELPLNASSFDRVRTRLDRRVLRTCQQEALAALSSYYAPGGQNAACVMSVGAGKTALGVAATLAFTRHRALIVTPGTVIRGTFDAALAATKSRSVLYNLPSGPLLPGAKAPNVLVLDSNDGAISNVAREQLLAADVIVTNFHALGEAGDDNRILGKLHRDEIDFVVIDEAHIAAADSYQRLFRHFSGARTLLMSACFQRLDGKPIDADVVYRYRLIDSILDGTAKNLRVHRFAPDTEMTEYQVTHPDGSREIIVGREALLDILRHENRIASITAVSPEPIRRVLTVTKRCLEHARPLYHPIRPRVLIAAVGQAHAQQVATIARQVGLRAEVLHHSMSPATVSHVRERFESEGGDLDTMVQLRMLGQGYDFPPISIVVPLRPYGSFAEFYQFIGRGIRVLQNASLAGRIAPEQQILDLVLHTELGLDEHLATVLAENDMDPASIQVVEETLAEHTGLDTIASDDIDPTESPDGSDMTAGWLEAFVLVERGVATDEITYADEHLAARREERELEAIALRYADYVAQTENPVPFDVFVDVIRRSRG
ncbi:DEAD/DEAH box helicase family protein [Microbacterium rhizosphaerae]|uniref:DEAD/DEAH box helicase family protein n=1 Tax=Microbacterium rhizosphaerae TaxID=1678237 RepID=A0ABZ0ST61_9MICO|nr:DEAD/DEAH box helicase family protein [Microbacterium rhizosphaerae]WPR91355.1 DEAD/DEAH box helicase family protein [Microbacterium rhizosphaerae]